MSVDRDGHSDWNIRESHTLNSMGWAVGTTPPFFKGVVFLVRNTSQVEEEVATFLLLFICEQN